MMLPWMSMRFPLASKPAAILSASLFVAGGLLAVLGGTTGALGGAGMAGGAATGALGAIGEGLGVAAAKAAIFLSASSLRRRICSDVRGDAAAAAEGAAVSMRARFDGGGDGAEDEDDRDDVVGGGASALRLEEDLTSSARLEKSWLRKRSVESSRKPDSFSVGRRSA